MSSAAPPRTKLWTIFSSASWRASAAYLVFATFATIRSRRLKKKSPSAASVRSEEHTSELQSHLNLVCRLLLEKKNTKAYMDYLGDFLVGFITAQFPSLVSGTDYNFFTFPTITPAHAGACNRGAHIVVEFED